MQRRVAVTDTYGRVRSAPPRTSDPGDRARRELIESAGGCIRIHLKDFGLTTADALVRIAAGRSARPCGCISACISTGRLSGEHDISRGGHLGSQSPPALYVGVETVKTHLRNVFAKLQLRNRVEAAMFVQRSGAFVRLTSIRRDG